MTTFHYLQAISSFKSSNTKTSSLLSGSGNLFELVQAPLKLLNFTADQVLLALRNGL